MEGTYPEVDEHSLLPRNLHPLALTGLFRRFRKNRS